MKGTFRPAPRVPAHPSRTAPLIPVIYLTAVEPDAELAVSTLGYPLLAKPVQEKELLALVARQIRPRPAP